ncbi:hypothetical protein [Streptomyces sp. NPDC060205]|uniref:hypothetical protein n=1 Tax=Streptomyces sp. NPDC060205 TaxID=3347072 RepID=UPI003659F0F0
MTRGVAGRRVLQVVLLVGGLFVLGFLCGERAHAADGVVPAKKPTELVRSVTGSAERLTSGTPHKRSGEQRPGEQRPGEQSPGSHARPVPLADEVHRVVRPVTEDVVRPVIDDVVQPVTELIVPPAAGHGVQPIGDLVDQITDGVVGGIADGLGEGAVEQPDPPQWWPSVPQLPTLPGVPELPESSVLPLPLPLPAIPGQTLPAGSTAEPQRPGEASGPQRAAGKQSAAGSGPAEYGPRFAGDLAPAGDGVHHQGRARSGWNDHVTGAVQAPVHQIPDGDPAGALARHSAVDTGSPRHGDAQAVTFNERARLTLVPGAAADATAAGPRDRHRDVPAFPG